MVFITDAAGCFELGAKASNIGLPPLFYVDVNDDSATTEADPILQFGELLAPGLVGDCQQQTVEIVVDEEGEFKGSGPEIDLAVNVSVIGGVASDVKLYSDSTCQTETSSVVYRATHAGPAIYYKFSSAGTTVLNVSAEGYPPVTGREIEGI